MRVLIINGPNLNLLGTREPSIYGTYTFTDFLSRLQIKFPQVEVIYHQSNCEGAIIDWLHQYDNKVDGVVINAGAYTHTSLAIHDAIRAITTPVVEVHISNVYAREPFRHRSMIAPACKGAIAGFGLTSYELAINYLLSSIDEQNNQNKKQPK